MARFFKSDQKDTADIKRVKFSMIAYYAFIIIGITVFISVSTIGKTDDVLKSKVSELVADLNIQMKMNLDSYLSRVETMAALAFADKEFYTYDATDESNDEYDALNTESSISDQLYNLCLMENFVDFSVVYSNNHVVGKLSNNTKDLFGGRLYEDLSAIITRERTHDGWLAGYNGNFNRIYYVKRVNANAILLTSFYSTELESIFEHPGGIADIDVRLIEDNGVMLYSSQDAETGTLIGYEIRDRIGGLDSVTMVDNDYLISVTTCGDHWRVVSSIPTRIILQEEHTVQLYTLTIGSIAAIIAIVLSMILSFGVSNSVDKTFTVLTEEAHVDQLTGILNKRSFERNVDSVLKRAAGDMRYALMLIDIDDFKSVNDTFGHAYGDKVLEGIGENLRNTFRSDDVLGRLGGDEFCVFMTVKGSMNAEERNQLIGRKCHELLDALRTPDDVNGEEYSGSASIGVAVYPEHGSSFESLYKMADSALYVTKRRGKNDYTIYEEEN